MDLELLRAQLIKHEGYKLKPYTDTVGKVTIGVGHNLTDKGLSPAAVDLILTEDINEVERFLRDRLPWTLLLDDVRQRAVYDLAFNLGSKLLTFTTTLRHLEHHEWREAADALLNSLYAKQVGRRAKAIATMILTGQDPL